MIMVPTQVILVSVFLMLLRRGQSQYPLQACCDQRLMDATQQVAIETGKPLPVGDFAGMRVRLCTTDSVLIQVWTLLSDTSVQLKWQTTFTPTSAQNSPGFVTVSFDTTVTIAANDRLGVYGIVAGSSWTKLPIPYELDPINGATRFTQLRYNNTSVFISGLQAQLNSVIMPRTFSSFVTFCVANDCSDQPTVPAVSSPTAPPSCGCPTTCSPDAVLRDAVNQQVRSTQSLSDQIARTSEIVSALASSTVSTGLCPTNMVPGSYSIGSCYAIIKEELGQAEAAIKCGTTWNANLVKIESSIEEDFLYHYVLNATSGSTTGVSLWTAGVYSQRLAAWTWYNQDGSRNPILADNTYQNWENGVVPTPRSTDICLVLSVDPVGATSTWKTANCFAPRRFFICEYPKSCF